MLSLISVEMKDDGQEMIWVSERDGYIQAKCPKCLKVSNIKTSTVVEDGIYLKLAGDGTCSCGFQFNGILKNANKQLTNTIVGLLILLIGNAFILIGNLFVIGDKLGLRNDEFNTKKFALVMAIGFLICIIINSWAIYNFKSKKEFSTIYYIMSGLIPGYFIKGGWGNLLAKGAMQREVQK